MNQDGGEKTFEATHGRLERAKRDGDLPRSNDLSGAFAFAGGLTGLLIAVPFLGAAARASFFAIAANPLRAEQQRGPLSAILLWAIVPSACSALAGSALCILQSAGLRPTAISFRFSRLSPLEGLRRMLSREALFNAGRAFLAVIGAGFLIAPTIFTLLASGRTAHPMQTLAVLAWPGAIRCAFLIALLGALFGSADFAMVVSRWRRKMRMSFDEVKRDHKEQDGDPAAKSRRRSMHRELSRTSIRRLKDAAFVVVNPTHVAIALEYRPPQVAVPRVLVKAAGEYALRVREASVQMKIPVIENVPLARALFANARAGEFIPKQSYVAVAEIVAALAKAGVLAS